MGGLFGSGGSTVSTSEPRIGSLRIQQSSYGLPLPIVWGQTRITGNLLWFGDFNAIPHTSSSSSGGGKGGGGVTQQNTTYTYEAAIIIGLGEGVISQIKKVWRDKEQFNSLADIGLTLATGTPGQATWGYLTTNHASEAIGYSETAYVYGSAYQLSAGAELQNHSFEAASPYQYGSGIVDANPADIVQDYLTNLQYGTGFPVAKIASLTKYSDYCRAAGLFISPALVEQRQAHEHLTEFASVTNSEIVWSDGVLKIIPYGDAALSGNGATYAPNLVPEYDFTDDDFIADAGSDPVTVRRRTNADAYNQVQIEYLDRANDYNVTIAEVKDQANIEQYGLRPKEPVKMHSICMGSVATAVAQFLLMRELYVRNEYEFTVGWRYARLEPMDLITITDAALGFNRFPVRITDVAENDNGDITLTAEDFPIGISSTTAYPSQVVAGYAANYNAAPGSVIAPMFFEPPLDTSAHTIKVAIAVTGDNPMWGGCDVYASLDGDSYQRFTTIHGGARYGVTAGAIGETSGASLPVVLSGNGGQMLSGTALDAEMMATACYVGGEYLGYQTATLTAANAYTLTGLVRGGYGSTAQAHPAGTPFVRFDNAVAESDPLDTSLIGQPIYFKFVSFNVFGGGREDLQDVTAYSHTITGVALTGALPNVQNLTMFYRGGVPMLSWDAVDDARLLDYEVRKGPTWNSAQTIGRVTATEFVIDGDGMFWVAARAAYAYSSIPASLEVEGASSIVKNVILQVDEDGTGWSGSLSGGAIRLLDSPIPGIRLSGAGAFASIPVLSAVPSVMYYGVANSPGIYTVPAEHEIDIGTSQACNVGIAYGITLDNPFTTFASIPVLSAVPSLLGDYSGGGDVRMEISTAGNDGIYGPWQTFNPGQYVARKMTFRAVLTSNMPHVTPILTSMDISVDVPDRVDVGTVVNCPDTGLNVVFSRPFVAPPNVQITILNAYPGDDAIVTPPTVSGFSVLVMNGGVPVNRNINWLAQGY